MHWSCPTSPLGSSVLLVGQLRLLGHQTVLEGIQGRCCILWIKNYRLAFYSFYSELTH